ncbi:hypothetical protein DFJ58DRAFT_811688 [Suillus subalutaceus]|uniref:uncharacterized protein n=1 Tax=Suillus subalutaceus TaxID=48586 RepID=UPI001B85C614|nr:uncharacterized protein DFJ58DRAFT_811688 [Suillus subalutaceus]KAG1839757.1 hypothetical protein DFJ58DRAFT_811688 [Suillus subalutaceus]
MLLDENLHREVRSVQNIEVHYCDLFPLLSTQYYNPGHKLPSPILNAFGAIIQDVPASSFLSSWIPALATGEATPTRAEGSTIEHVQAACGNLPLDDALQRPRWMIPLCGGCPSHFVGDSVAVLQKLLKLKIPGGRVLRT